MVQEEATASEETLKSFQHIFDTVAARDEHYVHGFLDYVKDLGVSRFSYGSFLKTLMTYDRNFEKQHCYSLLNGGIFCDQRLWKQLLTAIDKDIPEYRVGNLIHFTTHLTSLRRNTFDRIRHVLQRALYFDSDSVDNSFM